MTTPKSIESLKDNQIFVFGSNLNGNHSGGAAKLAREKFGAVEGVGEGITGQSYAFQTLNEKMNRVSMISISSSVNKLYECAKSNPAKQFLVTKVGCGIAGFKEKNIKKAFSNAEKPENVILPEGWCIVRGYKAFNKGLTCREFQYKLGHDFHHEGEIKLCQSGFHFCKSLGEVYNYYQFGTDIIIGEIESEGEVIDEDGGNKSVTNHIRITRLLNAQEASNNSGINNTGHSNTGHSNTGHSNTGDRNTGDRNTGHSNTGHSNTGDRNTGHRNTGDRNTGYWNTGDRNTGHFNTITQEKIFIFNKKSSIKKWESAIVPYWLNFDLTQWINFEDMTQEEKSKYSSASIQGGYLKKLDYREAFQNSYEKASKEQQQAIKNLPNFNKKVFFEISGIMID